MNKVIAVYFDEPEKLGYPLNYTVYYDSYRLFSEYCASRGFDLFIVRGDSYQGQMIFSAGWRYENGVLQDYDKPIRADLIYIKGLEFRLTPGPGDLIIDDPAFDALTSSKLQTFEAIGEYMIPSFEINASNWQSVLESISTDLVVLKPDNGAAGKGVMVLPKADLDFTQLGIEDKYLAQPFLDSSQGIEGITDTYHDLRVLVFGDTPRLSFLRTPKEGSYLSNAALGGKIDVVPFEKIPQSVHDIVQKVAEKFSVYGPKVYSIDFMFANNQPVIVELNTRPGFPHPVDEGESFTEEFFSHLVDVMEQAIKESK